MNRFENDYAFCISYIHIYIYIEMLIFLSIIKISIETYSIQMKGDKVKKNLWKIFRQIFKVINIIIIYKI